MVVVYKTRVAANVIIRSSIASTVMLARGRMLSLAIVMDVCHVTRVLVDVIVDGLASTVWQLDVVRPLRVVPRSLLAVAVIATAVLVRNRVLELVLGRNLWYTLEQIDSMEHITK